ncbi:helix-turn-helix domain-containing protein [Prosthecochloris vibrioformis]|uniref:Helix-turn-helix transcriptional regulator n=1 Tax=Prosthecochloris vibrioformis TaxID=1098 RepID=A0A5C4RT23_PROVB|nr:helix-turn-helix transcriptional regulator [Prosthecochloris vibrioformis]TNJ34021.1 helix-turn-helix transcriptional regulator [Prosthecochloris vibrioformis]
MSDCSIAEKLGRRVRALRLDRGYSQEAFAEMADLHRTYIGMVKRDEKNITVRNAEKIANDLNVSLSDILVFCLS